MSEQVKATWLQDGENGSKIAPKTLSNQVYNEDGTKFKDDFDNLKSNVVYISDKEIGEIDDDPTLLKTDVIDNLESTSPYKVLSANQGRVLNEKIEDNQNEIVSLNQEVDLKANDEELQEHKNNGTIHVTANDKIAWSNKQNALSSQVVYTAKGNATKVPQITTNALGQVTKIEEVTITQPTLLSQLSEDANHRIVTDAEKTAWNNKVDKETGKSLVSDTEIARLSNVHNYDDSEVKDEISYVKDTIEGYEQKGYLSKNLCGFGYNITDLTKDYRKDEQSLIIKTIDENSIHCTYGIGTWATAILAVEGIDGTKDYTISFKIKDNNTSFKPSLSKWDGTQDSSRLMLALLGGNATTAAGTGKSFVMYDIQIVEGKNVDTSFRPYCPPNTEIINNANAIIDNLVLGWKVPKECPIHNNVNNSKFVQSCNRIELSKLTWSKATQFMTDGFYFKGALADAKSMAQWDDKPLLYSDVYDAKTFNNIRNKNVGVTICYDAVIIYDDSFSDVDTFVKYLEGKYLYYELTNPIVTTIDGNEKSEKLQSEIDTKADTTELTKVKETLTEYEYDLYLGKNFLNLNDFSASSRGGVTFTPHFENGKLQYISLNGTATGATWSNRISFKTKIGESYTVNGVNDSNYYIGVYKKNDSTIIGNARQNAELTFTADEDLVYVYIMVAKDSVVNNLKCYPMIRLASVTDSTYTPYVPSNAQITTNSNAITDMLMLGWRTPAECPVQNSVSGNVFTQRVVRKPLWELEFNYSNGIFVTGMSFSDANIETGYIRIYEYNQSHSNMSTSLKDKEFGYNSSKYVAIKDSAYTDVDSFKAYLKAQNAYLYYELATPVQKVVDGNEVGYKTESHIIGSDENLSAKFTNNVNRARYMKNCGNIIINFNFSAKEALSTGDYVLFTLPVGYRPTAIPFTQIIARTRQNKLVYLMVRDNGEVSMTAGEQINENDAIIVQMITA